MAVAAAAEKQPALHYYAQLRFLAQLNHWLISVFVQRVCMCVYISSNSLSNNKKIPLPPLEEKKSNNNKKSSKKKK
jgi:hypothetical protein